MSSADFCTYSIKSRHNTITYNAIINIGRHKTLKKCGICTFDKITAWTLPKDRDYGLSRLFEDFASQ
jgi:hypothetical protein